MRMNRLSTKSGTDQPKSRYAIVADGGADPLAPLDTANDAALEPTTAVSGVERPAVDVPEDHGPGPGSSEELSPEELARRSAALAELLATMRPAVQMDGGDLALVDVDYRAGVVEVELQGACGSCAISSTTLKGGVERLLKERLAWVTEVRGGVDDSVDPFESAAMGRGAYVPRYY